MTAPSSKQDWEALWHRGSVFIHGAEFPLTFISRMDPSDSFFLPCLDIPETKRQLRAVAKRYKIKFIFDERVEKSLYGLRVWRIA